MSTALDRATPAAWRITSQAYAESAFTGEGARLYGNRFNSKGTRVVYAAESLPLALLEILVGCTDYDQLHQYVFFRAELPAAHVEERARRELPDGGNTHSPTEASKRIGDA